MAPKQTDPQFKLRMPPELKEALDTAILSSGRTLNAEMVWRLEQSFSWAKLIKDYETAEQRLAEQATTERELRRQIELLEEQVAMLKNGELEIDLTNAFVQDAMIQRVKEVMSGVADDMREEQRIANGMPLLLRWFDDNPEERASYDALPAAEQEEFVRAQAHALWIESLNAKREARPKVKPTVKVTQDSKGKPRRSVRLQDK